MSPQLPPSRTKVLRLTVCLVILAAALSPLAGAAPRPKTSGSGRGSEAKVPVAVEQSAGASVRLWKTASSAGRSLVVRVAPPGDKAKAPAQELGRTDAGYYLAEYAPTPAGLLTFTVLDAGGSGQMLCELREDIHPGSRGTLLVCEAEKGSPRLQYIRDSEPDEPANETRLSVRNLTSGLSDVDVEVVDIAKVRLALPGGYVQFGGLRPASAQITTHGTLSNGEKFEWSTEADLARSPKVTLLIYPDPYGRIRPRLYIDGEGEIANKQTNTDKSSTSEQR